MMLQPLLSVAGPQQGEMKGGMTRRIRGLPARRRHTGRPAGLDAARHGLGRDPEHENRHAGGFGRQRETAARGQIIGPRLAPELDHHRAEGRAPGAFQPGLERGERVACMQEQDMCGIEAQFHKACRIRHAGLAHGRFMPDPESRAAPVPLPQHQGESGKARSIRLPGRIHLVQGPAREREGWRCITLVIRLHEGGRHTQLSICS